MDHDLIFVVGLLLAAFSIPSLVAAFSDRRWPIAALFMMVLAGVAVGFAMQENPGAYSVATVDDVIVEVIGGYLN